jgi:sulfatase modifying factor 1
MLCGMQIADSDACCGPRSACRPTAIVGGWTPAPGGGKHGHLNAGRGLAILTSPSAAFETGWDDAWDDGSLGPAVVGYWNKVLSGGPSTSATWTPSPGDGENRPIVFATWAEARYRLPACKLRRHEHPAAVPGRHGRCRSESPNGDGKWGQADLAGNASEWTLDWLANYVNPSVDAGNLGQAAATLPGATRSVRGGGTDSPASEVVSSGRIGNPATFRAYDVGFRCARQP